MYVHIFSYICEVGALCRSCIFYIFQISWDTCKCNKTSTLPWHHLKQVSTPTFWWSTVQPMVGQLSIKTYLKGIYANDCFGKANFISTKSSCGVTAEILISAYRIWHRKWVWTAQASDPRNLPGCLLYSEWNRMANVHASYPARPSVPSGAGVSLMEYLTAWRSSDEPGSAERITDGVRPVPLLVLLPDS